MNLLDIEHRWNSIIFSGLKQYTLLRISSDCVPELYLAIDRNGNRFLILEVPKGLNIKCSDVELQNLSIQWHGETRLIIIGLLNKQFIDLYNDLTLSLYNHIKGINNPETYTTGFIHTFNKWRNFFNDNDNNELSEAELKGIFGELIILNWYLENKDDIETDAILDAWQGPYNSSQDFIFSDFNLEVKTKNEEEPNVRISNEFQLEPEIGKKLEIAIVNVRKINEGTSLEGLITSIKNKIIEAGGDLSIFFKALLKAGVAGKNVDKYINYKWLAQNVSFYNCNDDLFPKIISSGIATGVSRVKYNLNVSVLAPFLIKKIEF